MELSLSNRQMRGEGAHNAGGLTKQASLVTLVQSHPLRSQSSYHTGGRYPLPIPLPIPLQGFIESFHEALKN